LGKGSLRTEKINKIGEVRRAGELSAVKNLQSPLKGSKGANGRGVGIEKNGVRKTSFGAQEGECDRKGLGCPAEDKRGKKKLYSEEKP